LTVEQCKSAKVTMTVEDTTVIGQAQFANDAPNISGTVRGDGSFGATIGRQPLVGKFSADGFEGTPATRAISEREQLTPSLHGPDRHPPEQRSSFHCVVDSYAARQCVAYDASRSPLHRLVLAMRRN
jgi:hypothetical protein